MPMSLAPGKYFLLVSEETKLHASVLIILLFKSVEDCKTHRHCSSNAFTLFASVLFSSSVLTLTDRSIGAALHATQKCYHIYLAIRQGFLSLE